MFCVPILFPIESATCNNIILSLKSVVYVFKLTMTILKIVYSLTIRLKLGLPAFQDRAIHSVGVRMRT